MSRKSPVRQRSIADIFALRTTAFHLGEPEITAISKVDSFDGHGSDNGYGQQKVLDIMT